MNSKAIQTLFIVQLLTSATCLPFTTHCNNMLSHTMSLLIPYQCTISCVGVFINEFLLLPLQLYFSNCNTMSYSTIYQFPCTQNTCTNTGHTHTCLQTLNTCQCVVHCAMFGDICLILCSRCVDIPPLGPWGPQHHSLCSILLTSAEDRYDCGYYRALLYSHLIYGHVVIVHMLETGQALTSR